MFDRKSRHILIGLKTRYEISTMADKVAPSLIETWQSSLTKVIHFQKFSTDTYAVDILHTHKHTHTRTQTNLVADVIISQIKIQNAFIQ